MKKIFLFIFLVSNTCHATIFSQVSHFQFPNGAEQQARRAICVQRLETADERKDREEDSDKLREKYLDNLMDSLNAPRIWCCYEAGTLSHPEDLMFAEEGRKLRDALMESQKDRQTSLLRTENVPYSIKWIDLTEDYLEHDMETMQYRLDGLERWRSLLKEREDADKYENILRCISSERESYDHHRSHVASVMRWLSQERATLRRDPEWEKIQNAAYNQKREKARTAVLEFMQRCDPDSLAAAIRETEEALSRCP